MKKACSPSADATSVAEARASSTMAGNDAVERSQAGCRRGGSQRGAVAIEFAAVFVVFFMVFYAIVGYTVPLLMLFKFNELSAEATRSAVAVEQDAQWEARVGLRVEEVLQRSWLPANWREPCYSGAYFRVQADALDPRRRLLEVCIQYPYVEHPIIPILRLPGGINVPGVPDVLRGEASIRL